MKKEQVIQKILDVGLVAVVRAESEEQGLKVAEACYKGGVAALEITFTVPGADKIIAALAKKYNKGEIILGAGTVLDPETARAAILAGAQYIVAPSLNPDTIRLCNRYRVPIMPGCMSVKECVEALELGCDIIKLFPGDLLGPKAISSLRGPLPQAQFMPTGGVSADNCADWIKAGAVAVGAGGGLVKGSEEDIIRNAQKFLAAIKAARGN